MNWSPLSESLSTSRYTNCVWDATPTGSSDIFCAQSGSIARVSVTYAVGTTARTRALSV